MYPDLLMIYKSRVGINSEQMNCCDFAVAVLQYIIADSTFIHLQYIMVSSKREINDKPCQVGND